MSSYTIDTNSFGLTFINDANQNITYGSYIGPLFGGFIRATTVSSNSSTGSLVLINGGCSINNTNIATGTSVGGAVSIAGGVSIFKNTIARYVNLNNSSSNLLSIAAVDNLEANSTGNLVHMAYQNATSSNSLMRPFSIVTPLSTNDNNGLNPVAFKTNDQFSINVNSSSRLFLSDTNYFIAIGNSLGTSRFSVMNTQGSSSEMRINNALFTQANLRLGMPIVPGSILPNSQSNASILTNDYGPMQLITNASGTPNTILIDTTGNVGINTTTPSFTLDINGTGRITTSITTNGMYTLNSTITNLYSVNSSIANLLSTNSTINNNNIINACTGTLISSSITTGNINLTNNLYKSGTVFIATSQPWVSGTGGNLFYTAGNVGIGTTAPSFNLDVSGTYGSIFRAGVTTSNVFISTGNIFLKNNLNSTGTILIGTAGTVTTNTFKTMTTLLRTSRANANKTVSTWYTRTMPTTSWWNIVWSPDLSIFVATGNNAIATSPDGINWTSRVSPANVAWRGLCWSPELSLFLSCAQNGSATSTIMTSPNGITWTTRTTPTAVVNTGAATAIWSPERALFLIANFTNSTVITSPNGINWTTRASAANNSWYNGCWSPELNLFVLVGGTGGTTQIQTSPDGINWTLRTTPTGSYVYNGICWSPELSLFVAVSGNTVNAIITSPDGITWTTRTVPSAAANYQFYNVCWSPELSLFLIAPYTSSTTNGSAGSNLLLTSSNGFIWSTLSVPTTDYRMPCWSPELSCFAIVGNNSITTSNFTLTSSFILPNSKTFLVSPAHMTYNQQTGAISVVNALSKGSGSFDIPHPLIKDKRLVHSFIEGPRCDLIYRGTVQLVNGTATVNIDHDSVANPHSAMTQGTFEALTTNPIIKLQNHTSFKRIRGIISGSGNGNGNGNGNLLTIICQDPQSSDTIHWCVIAERKDTTVKEWDRTNEQGYLITEYN